MRLKILILFVLLHVVDCNLISDLVNTFFESKNGTTIEPGTSEITEDVSPATDQGTPSPAIDTTKAKEDVETTTTKRSRKNQRTTISELEDTVAPTEADRVWTFPDFLFTKPVFPILEDDDVTTAHPKTPKSDKVKETLPPPTTAKAKEDRTPTSIIDIIEEALGLNKSSTTNSPTSNAEKGPTTMSQEVEIVTNDAETPMPTKCGRGRCDEEQKSTSPVDAEEKSGQETANPTINPTSKDQEPAVSGVTEPADQESKTAATLLPSNQPITIELPPIRPSEDPQTEAARESTQENSNTDATKPIVPGLTIPSAPPIVDVTIGETIIPEVPVTGITVTTDSVVTFHTTVPNEHTPANGATVAEEENTDEIISENPVAEHSSQPPTEAGISDPKKTTEMNDKITNESGIPTDDSEVRSTAKTENEETSDTKKPPSEENTSEPDMLTTTDNEVTNDSEALTDVPPNPTTLNAESKDPMIEQTPLLTTKQGTHSNDEFSTARVEGSTTNHNVVNVQSTTDEPAIENSGKSTVNPEDKQSPVIETTKSSIVTPTGEQSIAMEDTQSSVNPGEEQTTVVGVTKTTSTPEGEQTAGEGATKSSLEPEFDKSSAASVTKRSSVSAQELSTVVEDSQSSAKSEQTQTSGVDISKRTIPPEEEPSPPVDISSSSVKPELLQPTDDENSTPSVDQTSKADSVTINPFFTNATAGGGRNPTLQPTRSSQSPSDTNPSDGPNIVTESSNDGANEVTHKPATAVVTDIVKGSDGSTQVVTKIVTVAPEIVTTARSGDSAPVTVTTRQPTTGIVTQIVTDENGNTEKVTQIVTEPPNNGNAGKETQTTNKATVTPKTTIVHKTVTNSNGEMVNVTEVVKLTDPPEPTELHEFSSNFVPPATSRPRTTSIVHDTTIDDNGNVINVTKVMTEIPSGESEQTTTHSLPESSENPEETETDKDHQSSTVDPSGQEATTTKPAKTTIIQKMVTNSDGELINVTEVVHLTDSPQEDQKTTPSKPVTDVNGNIIVPQPGLPGGKTTVKATSATPPKTTKTTIVQKTVTNSNGEMMNVTEIIKLTDPPTPTKQPGCAVSQLSMDNSEKVKEEFVDYGFEFTHTCNTNYSFNDNSTEKTYTCMVDGKFGGYDEDNICEYRYSNGDLVVCSDPYTNIKTTNAQETVQTNKNKGNYTVGTMIIHSCLAKFVFKSTGAPMRIYECLYTGNWTRNLHGEACQYYL